MKKQGTLLGIVALVVFAVYNAIVFVIKTDAKDASFWISYAFTAFAFLVAVISLILIGRKKGIIQNWFMNYPIVRYSVIYVISQVVVSVILIVIGDKLSVPVAFLIQFVLLAIYVILILIAFVAKISVEEASKSIKAKCLFVDLLRVDAEMLCEKCSDSQALVVFKDFAEAVSLSDPMSSQTLSAIEGEISTKISDANKSLSESDIDKAIALCKEAKLLLVERNKKARVLK